jgi:hypothetical protein
MDFDAAAETAERELQAAAEHLGDHLISRRRERNVWQAVRLEIDCRVQS